VGNVRFNVRREGIGDGQSAGSGLATPEVEKLTKKGSARVRGQRGGIRKEKGRRNGGACVHRHEKRGQSASRIAKERVKDK